jgi:dTDP-4-dehydrorhamnose reductase
VTQKILVSGGGGQVGIEMGRLEWPDGIEVVAPSRDQLDITDAESVARLVSNMHVACVINLAAYTAVDKAEEDVAGAFLVNAQGAALLAEAARDAGAPIVHVSTDYVFDGSANKAYRESDCPNPLNTYGASKLAGELAIRAANPRSLIVRTAWVLSAHRSNFIKTMLRLAATSPEVRVVDDQRGCPTSAADIAAALQHLAMSAISDPATLWGTYHFVNSGETSWHDLAGYIFEWLRAQGSSSPSLTAIKTADYPTPARRPGYSGLDTNLIAEAFGIIPRPWQQAVDEILYELASREEQGSQG